MRRFFSTLLFISVLSPLTSCHENNDFKSIPIFKNDFSTETINDVERYYCNQLTIDDLNRLINSKADFFLYVYLPGCGTCELFPITLDNYIKETNSVINYCLLNTFAQLEESPNLTSSSFVFYQNGKIEKIENLDKYMLEPDKFQNMLDQFTYLTDIHILNPTYIENYDSLFYPSYTFYPFCKEKPEQGYYYTLVEKILETTTNILLIDETKFINSNELLSIIENLQFDYLGFIGQDILDNREDLSALFKCEEFSTITYLQYNEGKLINQECFEDSTAA